MGTAGGSLDSPVRGPQSVQSVPRAQPVVVEFTPPSSHWPSPAQAQVSMHPGGGEGGLGGGGGGLGEAGQQ